MLQAAKNPEHVITWLNSINQIISKKQINQINQIGTIIELKHMK